MENQFTNTIEKILKKHFGKKSVDIFEKSQLLQYINLKTKSANKGAKARGSFANLYILTIFLTKLFYKARLNLIIKKMMMNMIEIINPIYMPH